MHEANQSSYRVAVAVALAALCHVTLLILLSQTRWQPEIQRRIPFTLIATSETALERGATAPSLSTDAPAAVTSINSDMPFVFRTPDSLPERPSMRSPSADTSWIGKLFSSEDPNRTLDQEPDATANEVTQVARQQELPILGPYHAQLIQILARSKYHDKQYEFASLTTPRSLVLKLKLHASGALLRVDVETSSGDEELDAAAQRSAYAASPFPPPPEADGVFSYLYPVEIQYLPRK